MRWSGRQIDAHDQEYFLSNPGSKTKGHSAASSGSFFTEFSRARFEDSKERSTESFATCADDGFTSTKDHRGIQTQIVLEAAAAGADAVLLIAAAVDDVSLCRLRAVAEDELGLDALVEAHTSGELRRALNAGARIIGINNRDLRTFRVSLNTSERLIAEAPADRILISESGLQSADSLLRLRKLGFRGFLIGEALMREHDPETALRDLVAAAENRQAMNDEIRMTKEE